MAETVTPLKQLSGVEQAVYFHSRERRRSLAGVLELFRTHLFAAIPDTIAANQFPARDVLVTFQTAIRITGAAPTGLVFEIGDATTAIAAWIDDDDISLRAGDALAADRGLATFTNGAGSLPIGLEVDLVYAVRPGDGRVRIWANGNELARDAAANGQLPNGWAAASAGAFASAAAGALPADVTQAGAPANFEVIEPLRVFLGSVPRHFI